MQLEVAGETGKYVSKAQRSECFNEGGVVNSSIGCWKVKELEHFKVTIEFTINNVFDDVCEGCHRGKWMKKPGNTGFLHLKYHEYPCARGPEADIMPAPKAAAWWQTEWEVRK